MIKCALFDLDGTLVNTVEDLGRAVDCVLEFYGKEKKWTLSDYRKFVGNGARKLIDRAFEHTLDDNELDRAFGIFKEKYNQILLDNACLYDGIKDALDLLKEQGVKLAVVTNKPHQSAVKMVTALFGEGYFDRVVGAREDKPKKPDPWGVLETLEKLGLKPEEAIYFGDSDIDVYTAKNAGVKCAACLWGYRSKECIEAAEPQQMIVNPKDIAGAVIN